ncbi:hypothetical protein TUM20984_03330 [Mycobacterium antarcticum]|nr:hypothetical protein TUM20984_03330 [Mycolicibacterium sp. TUM20984]
MPTAVVSDGAMPIVAITSSPIPQPLTIKAAQAIAALAVRGLSRCTTPRYRLSSTKPAKRLLNLHPRVPT